jgi:hypothetical protein
MPEPGPPDRLTRAERALRAAHRTPYLAAAAGAWRQHVLHFIEMAAHALDEHIADAEAPDGPLQEFPSRACWLIHEGEVLASEHPAMTEAVRSIAGRLASPLPPDVFAAVDVIEATKALEHDVARHRSRLLNALYESTNRVLGGEGG